jgi:hypothetical protein
MALYRMNPQNTLQKQMAENIGREAAALGCDQNKINQALGTAGGYGDGEGEGCPCIDEQGRRYRVMFGQECGTGSSAMRDYNCSGGGGDGNSQIKTPGSCYEGGMTVIHKLIDPPPYAGVNPICRDGTGKLWFQVAGRVHFIEKLVRGQHNRQTGCYEGSKVVTSSRTFEGRLCGP